MAACPSANDPRLVGDPVDTLTGAVVDRMLDFRLVGGIELRWWRHYDSSQSGRSFPLGHGFTHEFDRTLHADAQGMRFDEPIGRSTPFPRLWNDGERSARGGLTLTRLSLRRYALQRHAQPLMEFEFHAPRSFARLARLVDGPHAWRFDYDAAGRWLAMEDEEGRRIAVEEADDGQLISLTLLGRLGDPDTLLIRYRYDEHGNLIGTQNAAGHGYAFAYDAANRMVWRRGRKGFEFHFSYDAQGRCLVASGDGRLYGVAMDYAVPGRLTKVMRADQGVWKYHFGPTGALTAIDDPLGGRQKFVQDPLGRTVQEVDAGGNVTAIVHDAAGEAVARIDPLGYAESLPEDPNSPDPMSQRLAAHPAEYEFGRLLEVDAIRLPTDAQLAAGPLPPPVRPLVFTRSPRTATIDAHPPRRVKPMGVQWWPEPAQGRIFSPLGKLVDQLDDFGRQRQWHYDAAGNLAQYVDFDGARWAFDHGPWHFLLQRQDPNSHTCHWNYTTAGEVAGFEDPGGARSEYRYDLKDQLVEVRRHGVVRETYERGPTGKLVAKRASDGRLLLSLKPGPGDLLQERRLASGDLHQFTYGAAGLMLTAASNQDMVEFQYDAHGNRSAELRNGQGIEHAFAGLNALGQSTYFGRFAVQHRRRADGSLELTDSGGMQHVVRVMPAGLVERRFGNGSRETAQYDNRGRCLFKRLEAPAAMPWNRRFHWSGEGELRRIEDSRLGDIEYDYDAAHRLRGARDATRADAYAFDQAGNLIAQPGLNGVQLLEGNRLVEANGERFEFNDRNHVQARHGTGGTVRYVYDSRDLLVRVEMPHGTWEADYDALGRRTRKRWQGRTTEFFWNGEQLIAEIAPDGRLRLYVYADTLAQTPLLVLDYASVQADPAEVRRYTVFSDQLGTPCRLEDDSRQVVWSARHAPFGATHVDAGSQIEFNCRQPGHYFDAETGLHHNRFRCYDPVLGRYLQSDPWGITGGHNLYAYPANPLGECDLRGLGDEGGKKKKKGDDDCEDNKPLHERKGWVDKYGEQKKVTGDGSVDRDHQPSKAAIKKAALDEIDRRVAAGEITQPSDDKIAAINKRIDAEAQAVVVDKQVHKDGPTHGHKNDKARIGEDSKDLGKAAARDADAMVENAKKHDPDNVPKYEEAAKEIKKQNHESIMNGVNNIIDDELG